MVWEMLEDFSMNTAARGHSFDAETALLFHEDGLINQPLDFLCEAADQYGQSYDLLLTRTSRNPVVRSHSTGYYFLLGWPQIVRQAVAAGVDVNELAPRGFPFSGRTS
jgi:hypothetical protein